MAELDVFEREFKLLSVSFESSDSIETESDYNIEDSYNIDLKNDGNTIVINFTRMVDFSPEFKMSVNLEGEYTLKADVRVSDIKEVENNIDSFVYPITSHISQIISQLTMLNMEYPLVTPPFLMVNKENSST